MSDNTMNGHSNEPVFSDSERNSESERDESRDTYVDPMETAVLPRLQMDEPANAVPVAEHTGQNPSEPVAERVGEHPVENPSAPAAIVPPALVEPPTTATPPTAVRAALAEPVAVETASATPAEPILPTPDPAAVEIPAAVPVVQPAPARTPDPRVVYVEAPVPPRTKGNRGMGVLLAILGAVVFGILYALIYFIVADLSTGIATFAFLEQAPFFVPVIVFAVGFIVLVLIANRANWWAHVLGSLFVAVFVYFVSIGVLLLTSGILQNGASQAAERLRLAYGNLGIIIAALLAREVALWFGAAISARGRRVKAKNAEAREAYEREVAEKRGDDDRARVLA